MASLTTTTVSTVSTKRGRNEDTPSPPPPGLDQIRALGTFDNIIEAMDGICEKFGKLFSNASTVTSQSTNLVDIMIGFKRTNHEKYNELYGNILLYCSLKQAILEQQDGGAIYMAIVRSLQENGSFCFRSAQGGSSHNLLQQTISGLASVNTQTQDPDLNMLIYEIKKTENLSATRTPVPQRLTKTLRTERRGGRKNIQKGGGFICSESGKHIIAGALTGAVLAVGAFTAAAVSPYITAAIESVYGLMVAKGAALQDCSPGPIAYTWQTIKSWGTMGSVPSCRQIHELNRPATTWLTNKITEISSAINEKTGGHGRSGVLGVSLTALQQVIKGYIVDALCNAGDGSVNSLTQYDAAFRTAVKGHFNGSPDLAKLNSSVNLVLTQARKEAQTQVKAINDAADDTATTAAINTIATSNIVLNNAICTVDVNGGNFQSSDQTDDKFLNNLFGLTNAQLTSDGTKIKFLAPTADQLANTTSFRVPEGPFRKLYMITYAQELKGGLIPIKLGKLNAALSTQEGDAEKTQFFSILTNAFPINYDARAIPALAAAAQVQNTAGGKRRMTRKKKKHHKKRHHAKKHATKKHKKKGKRKTGKKHHKKRHHAKKHATRKHGKKRGRKTRKR